MFYFDVASEFLYTAPCLKYGIQKLSDSVYYIWVLGRFQRRIAVLSDIQEMVGEIISVYRPFRHSRNEIVSSDSSSCIGICSDACK